MNTNCLIKFINEKHMSVPSALYLSYSFAQHGIIFHLFFSKRDHSDHCPVTLSCLAKDYGPIPFRFYNSWLLNKDLFNIVNVVWNSTAGRGKADVLFATKLKAVKVAIKLWKTEAIDKERRNIVNLKSKVNMLEIVAEERDLTIEELDERKQLKKIIKDLEIACNMDLKQKARIK